MKFSLRNIFAVLFLVSSTVLHAQIQVSIPNASANIGDEVTIPINTANVALTDQVISFETEVHFNSSVLKPVDIIKTGTIVDNRDWYFVRNLNYAEGVLKFGAYSTGDYLNGSGAIAYLKFDVIGNPGDTSSVKLVNFFFNGNDPPYETTQNGVFTVNYSTIQIQTDPSGRQFNFDGHTYTAPQAFNVSPNSSHGVDVPDPQMDGSDKRYVWSSWSDGYAKSHSISAPASGGNSTFTAKFSTQYLLTTSVDPAGGGEIQRDKAGPWYDDGEVVTLTAVSASEYDFQSWDGDASGSNATVEITMNSAKSVIGRFKEWPTISIKTNPPGQKVLIDGTEYTAPQSYKWQPGSNHSIGVNSPQIISDNIRYIYSNWDDDGAQTHDISVPESDQTYTANFSTQYKLNLSANPQEGGSVSADPSETWQDENTQITLTATAGANFKFVGWGGDLSGTQNPTTLTMDGPKNVVGNFGETATVTIHTNPEGLQVWVDDSSQLHAAPYSFRALTNTQHTIGVPSLQNETSTSRMVWKSWDDGGTQAHEIIVTKTTPSYTATFGKQYKLLTHVLPAGAGSVQADPEGPWYDSGATVTLTAAPIGNYDFSEWAGDASGSNASVSITMDTNKDITANFKAWPHITITTAPSGLSMMVDGNPVTAPTVFQWQPGSDHTIAVDSPQTAGSDKRYVFHSWSDGKSQEHSIVTPESDATFTADFRTQYKLTTSVIPDGGGSIDADKAGPWYDENEVVILTETPSEQYDFDRWTGDAAGTETSVQVTMNTGKNVTANFKHWPEITITTDPEGKQITVDAVVLSSPQTFVWQPGSHHTIEAVEEQNSGNTTKYIWTKWSDGGDRSHSIHTPETNTTFTAFYKTQYYVQTQVSPSSGGSVSPESGWFDEGARISFSAAASEGYGFLNWSGSWSGSENPKSVSVHSAINVTANFSQYRQIIIHTNPEGLKVKADGNESVAPVTVNWLIGTTHSVDVTSPQSDGESVRYIWESWSDGERRSHDVQVTGSMESLTANFSREFYVTAHVNPQGAGTISPGSGWFSENSNVTFTEQPNEGYEFLQWSGDASGSQSSVQVVVDRAKEITANYNEWYLVTIRAQKTSATQTVLNIIVDGETYVSPHTFRAKPGSVHTIEAPETQSPEGQGRRYQYLYWSDRGARRHQITISSNNMEFVARYALQFHLAKIVNPEGAGTIQTSEEGEWIAAWKTAQVEAVAGSGYVFNEWQGDLQGKQNPTALYMDGPKSIQANFGPQIIAPVVSNFGINAYAIVQVDTIRLHFSLEDSSAQGSVSAEVLWFRNGRQDTLFNGMREILPQNLNKGDIWYAEFRVERSGRFSRWHRTNTCPVLPFPPANHQLFQFSGNDTTITVGDDSTQLSIHSTASAEGGQQIMGQPDTLEHSVNIDMIARSPGFYFNNTVGWYLLITGNLTNYSWSFTYRYADPQLREFGISQEDSLTLGWSEDLGNSWHYLDNTVVDTLQNVVQANGLTHFSLWAVGEKPFSQFFPVELSSFRAEETSGGIVHLMWETKTETNSMGFEIQRKMGNGPFEKIGFIKGAGTSARPHRYSFEDSPGKPGLFSYRLKQIDLNRGFHVTQEISVAVGAPISSVVLRNYPNPFNSSTTIKFSIPEEYAGTDAYVMIYDVIGKEVRSFKLPQVNAGFHEIQWNGKDSRGLIVPSGLFFYQLRIGNVRKMQKMILLK